MPPTTRNRSQSSAAALNDLSPLIWTKDVKIQETAEETANIYSLTKDLNFAREPEQENAYAPCGKGAHYVWVDSSLEASQKNNSVFVLCHPDENLQRDLRIRFQGFISIAFLAALATDSVSWDSLSRFVWPTIQISFRFFAECAVAHMAICSQPHGNGGREWG